MPFFEGFSSFDTSLSTGVTIHGIHSSAEPSNDSKPAILLLHGFPQNHLIWHKIAPTLASTYRVIAIDLRGYGQSSKPNVPGGKDEKHELYAKSKMAQDCVEVMEKLGETSFYVLSHDRGSRVAHKLCVDHPDKIKKVILLDICPTLAMYEATNLILAKIYWHWFFLVQPYPLPETFLLNSPEVLIRASFGGGGHALGSTPSAFHPDAVKSYEAMFRDSDGVHAMCEDYRAAASIDLEEQKEDINKERKIKCDVRVLWGGSGLVGRMFQPVEEWQKVSDGKVTGESVQCGHYIPEEAPDVVIKNTLEFFK